MKDLSRLSYHPSCKSNTIYIGVRGAYKFRCQFSGNLLTKVKYSASCFSLPKPPNKGSSESKTIWKREDNMIKHLLKKFIYWLKEVVQGEITENHTYQRISIHAQAWKYHMHALFCCSSLDYSGTQGPFTRILTYVQVNRRMIQSNFTIFMTKN